MHDKPAKSVQMKTLRDKNILNELNRIEFSKVGGLRICFCQRLFRAGAFSSGGFLEATNLFLAPSVSCGSF